MSRPIVLALALGLGCAPTADVEPQPTGDAGAEVDASPSRPDDCHHDCFGHLECRDGKVTVWAHMPVPCSYWTGSCPIREVYTCKKGCRADGDAGVGYWSEARSACEENRTRSVGDPCSRAADCLPTPAKSTSPTTVENVYLTCDLGTHRCVAAAAPVVADYLDPCHADFTGVPNVVGYVAAPACSGGVCLVAPASTGCRGEGCSLPCTGDHECPMGSTCDSDLPNLTPGAPKVSVCKVGPPGLHGIGLACRAGDAG